jgi:hypothetical protein
MLVQSLPFWDRNPWKRPVTCKPLPLPFPETFLLQSPRPRQGPLCSLRTPRCGTPGEKAAPTAPSPARPQLTAQQDAVGVLLAGHPAQRVAQRPPAAGAQEHQRPVLRRLLLARRLLRAGLRRVPARRVPRARPFLQQLVSPRVFGQPPAQQ